MTFKTTAGYRARITPKQREMHRLYSFLAIGIVLIIIFI